MKSYSINSTQTPIAVIFLTKKKFQDERTNCFPFAICPSNIIKITKIFKIAFDEKITIIWSSFLAKETDLFGNFKNHVHV